ncbi:hypothetical protein N5K27_26965 [Pigmentiphaga sp. GD03639]|uniref:hypothetical protein n=1 Tax=unclassified Pigmentiphaga TaxID=2626614 RepID=UPI00244A56C5|nr:hypothetical protein [Pigmentiphaga sp. GD03639]MDH2239942.1 hypothetical protein [Pigmentiphaga sp. GD03639]
MYRRLSLLVLALVTLHACSKSPPDPLPSAVPSATADGPPRYDAELVYVDFAGRDPRALEKYSKGPFIVTGRLQKVHIVGTGELQLDLKAADPAHPVRVRLKSDPACDGGRDCPEQVALDTLPRGFKVYLECERATLENGTPTVAGCVLTGAPGRIG